MRHHRAGASEADLIAQPRHAPVFALLAAAFIHVSCGSTPPAPLPGAPSIVGTSDPKDLAEALLLGSGALSDSANRGCAPLGVVVGWPSGSLITVRVSSQLPQSARTQIQQVVGRVAEATLDNVTATIQLTDQAGPRPNAGEVTVSGTNNPAMAGCSGAAVLCTMFAGFSVPFLHSVRIVGVPDGNFAHELGHGVFGFCHTKNPNVFDKETIMAGAWALTDRDVGIVQSVYRAGLGPGATRSELVQAGIVNP